MQFTPLGNMHRQNERLFSTYGGQALRNARSIAASRRVKINIQETTVSRSQNQQCLSIINFSQTIESSKPACGFFPQLPAARDTKRPTPRRKLNDGEESNKKVKQVNKNEPNNFIVEMKRPCPKRKIKGINFLSKTCTALFHSEPKSLLLRKPLHSPHKSDGVQRRKQSAYFEPWDIRSSGNVDNMSSLF